eukprot:CAMPEP_0198507282 /NCGR_PEP_ID=MMETSP1462-20131121/12216_1 /TAXON_ID=1333877 /ORGANISM="Brandtodinium nutriculum, Strain RCC3387" /LENGTH=291 /DNA_ID=CAMNT_0044236525 /DNA_START=55 /DNA_END=927 /DNA_ORIENTATION=-
MVRGSAAPEAAQPFKVVSPHQFRAARRYAKRREQELHIAHMEEQLQQWWMWWYSGSSGGRSEIDDEVIQRLRAIEPGIRAQVESSVQGQPHHSSRMLVHPDVHLRGNGAKHVFTSEPFSQITVSEIKHHKRARCHTTRRRKGTRQCSGGVLDNIEGPKRDFDAVRLVSSWQVLPSSQWARVYSRFPPLPGQLQVLGRRSDELLKDQWGANPASLPSGTRVIVHNGMHRTAGVVLRRGFGHYGDQYRVRFREYNGAENGDAWVECWQCVCPAKDTFTDVEWLNLREWWDHSV